MNRKLVASELLKVAQDLVAIDFPTDEAMKKYLDEHPDADKSNHKVVKTNPITERMAPRKKADHAYQTAYKAERKGKGSAELWNRAADAHKEAADFYRKSGNDSYAKYHEAWEETCEHNAKK